jgi:hypothetical protein
VTVGVLLCVASAGTTKETLFFDEAINSYSYFWLINPLNAELNPICHMLALLGAHPILHVSRIRVKVPMNKKYGQFI